MKTKSYIELSKVDRNIIDFELEKLKINSGYRIAKLYKIALNFKGIGIL